MAGKLAVHDTYNRGELRDDKVQYIRVTFTKNQEGQEVGYRQDFQLTPDGKLTDFWGDEASLAHYRALTSYLLDFDILED